MAIGTWVNRSTRMELWSVNRLQNIEARSGDKFHTIIELLSRFYRKSSLAFYVRYDYGHDYYNINFQNRVNRFQIGVAAR